MFFCALLTSAALVSSASAQPAGAKAGTSGAAPGSKSSSSERADATTTKTPDVLFKEAREAYKKGDYAAALKGFQAVWAVERQSKVVGNLGRTELKLKLYRDAAEHLDLFMRIEAGMDPEERATVFAELNEAKSHVTTLRIVVVPDASEVVVDGVSVGTSPVDHDLFVEAGHHKIEAHLRGRMDTKEIDTKEGSEWPVKLVLPERKEELPSLSKPQTSSPTRTVVFVGGSALTAIGLGIGIGTGAVALSKQQEENRCQTQACFDPIEPGRHTMAMASLAGFVFAGVAAIGTGTYLLFGPKGDMQKTSTALRVAPTGSGLVLSGSW